MCLASGPKSPPKEEPLPPPPSEVNPPKPKEKPVAPAIADQRTQSKSKAKGRSLLLTALNVPRNDSGQLNVPRS